MDDPEPLTQSPIVLNPVSKREDRDKFVDKLSRAAVGFRAHPTGELPRLGVFGCGALVFS